MNAGYLSNEIEIAAWTIASLKEHVPVLIQMADRMTDCLRAGGCIFTCGNGGSMAQAQHAVAELVGAFQNRDRAPLRAICLGTSAPMASAIGNDFGFEDALAREFWGLVHGEDVLWCFSTSGASENVLRAVGVARTVMAIDEAPSEPVLHTVSVLAFTGPSPSLLASRADLVLPVTSDSTARIQEVHLLALHLLCGIVEKNSLEFADDPAGSA